MSMTGEPIRDEQSGRWARTGTGRSRGESPSRTFLVLLPALLSLSFAGCDFSETNVSLGNREQILFLGNGSEPKGIDPHVVTGVTEHNIICALTEGLVAEDPEDLHPVPGTAESWEINPEGTVYTFHIRKDARWSNGDPVTARDFVYSFRRMLNPRLGAEYAYMLYPMKGAGDYNSGRITDFAEVGVRAVDQKTLRIELEHPTAYFLELMNHFSWWPVHPETVEEFNAFARHGSRWTRPGNFVGNGPFVLSEWQINRRIVVRKNPLYWDADRVKLNEIHFLPIDSADTEERSFRYGSIHISSTIPLHRIDYYRENRPRNIRFDTYLGTYFYRFNVTRPPFNDRRVRRALALTVNREELTRYVLKGGQQPAYNFTPPETGGYTCLHRFEADADQARRLLAEAGYPDGKGFPTATLLYNTSESHRVIAEAVQQMWKKELNVDITLMNQEWKVYLDTVKRLDYQIARAGWIGDYNDPNTFLDMWLAGGGNNRTGWSNTRFDRLIQSAGKTTDRETRFALFQKAEEILLQEMPIIPIYFYVRSLLIQTSVRGWHPTILDHHPYKYVFLQAPLKP